MKKSILGLAVSALLMVGAAHAGTNPNDVSATLSISGTVVPNDQQICTVVADQSSISLSSEVKNMPAQGSSATTGSVPLHLSLMNSVGADCLNDAAAGKIAYKFVGTADDADGSVIANTNTAEDAAKGVGVGVFDATMAPLKVNQDTILANGTPTGNIVLLQMVKLNGQEVVAGNLQSSLTIDIEHL